MSRKLIFILLIILILLNQSLIYIFNDIVFTDSFFYNILGNQFESSEIENFLTTNNKIESLSYFYIPILIILRCFFVSLAFYVYSKLNEQEKLFSSFFEVALTSEIVFIIQVVSKLIYIIIAGNTIENAQTMATLLSLNHFLEGVKVPKYLSYLFSCINLYDIAYLLALSINYASILKINSKKSFEIVCLTYLPLLFLWIVLITFLSI